MKWNMCARFGAAAVLCLAGSASAQVTLEVNRNPVTQPLMPVLIGALDPTVFTIEGPSNRAFELKLTEVRYKEASPAQSTVWGRVNRRSGLTAGLSFATAPASPARIIRGVLNAQGEANVLMAEGLFSEGQRFTVSASVTVGGSVLRSFDARATVVRTLSANIALNMVPGSMADIFGPVTEVGSNSVTVGNLVYRVSAATEFADDATLQDVSAGDWVEINGVFNASGGFDAMEIGIQDADDRVKLTGFVQSVGPSAIVLLGSTVFVSSQTDISDDTTGMPATFADVAEGMAVEAYIAMDELFPHVVELRLNIPFDVESEPEPEPETEEESENENPPPPPRPFCS